MTEQKDFVHLHVHTEYSLLDGLSRIGQVVDRAVELEMPALAITDHGTMFGVIDFFRKAKKAGIKPIIGVEAYLARRGMEDRDPQLDARPYHLLLLAKNQTGYKNLLKLTSEAQLRGYYYRPRIDKALLEQYSEGLIVTSGCLAAEIPRALEAGKDDNELREMIGWYQDVFGPENFYLELQQHDIPQLATLNKWLVANSKHADVPLIATNDVHYVLADDFDAHDTLLCIQTGNVKSETNRMRMTDPSYHLRTPAEMWDLFADVPEALTNTLQIAEMCEVDLESKGYHLPVFPVPPGYDAESYLRYLCEKGLRWRYGARADEAEIVQRLDYELDIIHTMGFDTYFLIVWDLCEFARHADIWWNVRGSGAGSVAAYSLGITNIDPLQNSLIFERFLNPGRVSMPDIDLDYPDDRRSEMIEYTAHKYGEDKVAAIITFGTMGSKAAIRDVGRALDMPLSDVDQIARLLPSGAKPTKFKDALGDDPGKAVPDFKQAYKSDKYVRDLIDMARKLEGVVRHASTHAAGVIVADKPLTEYIPLHRPTKGKEDDVPVKMVTQFDMETSESIGLLKVDFLGLATLTIMRKACELIERYHGIRYTMDNIPYRPDPADPEKTRMVEEMFELIGRGETVGIFQIESAGMRRMLTEMRPQTFEHIVAAISLYRPGPMDYIPTFNKRLHGEEKVEYKHELLAPILAETYGIIVYQEQIQQVAAQLFGYSLGEADLMRRAVSKKKEKELLKHRATFIERGPEHGVPADVAEAIFGDIEFFARYGFNKAHAADYAVITCQTAFLKTHYPVEYMTGLLSVQRDDTTKVSVFIAECRRMGIPILPPDVNCSELDFTIEKTPDGARAIRYGMAAVKNVGVGPLEHIIAQREEAGAFEDVSDFCSRVDLRVVQKRALESLIKVGALDQFGERPRLLAGLDRMMSHSAEQHRAAEVGQLSLFGEETGVTFDEMEDLLGNLPNYEPVPQREMLNWEKELVGLYVSSHPLDAVMQYIQHPYSGVQQSQEIKEAAETLNGRFVTAVGLVEGLRSFPTKRGDMMGVINLEDLQGHIDVVFFPRSWERCQQFIEPERVIRVRGKVDTSRGDVQIIGEEVSLQFDLPDLADEAAPPAPSLMPEMPPLWDDGLPPLDDDVDDGDEDDLGDDPYADAPLPEVIQSPEPPPPAPVVAPATAGAVRNAPNLVPQTVGEAVAEGVAVAPARAAVTADDPETLPPLITEQVEPAGTVIVRFDRSDDLDRDRRRLRNIHNVLRSIPGKDHFCVVFTSGGQDVVIDFPNHTTGYGDSLLQLLGRFPYIQVEWQAG